MAIQELISGVEEAMTVKRIFGQPYERDGTAVIPAAAIRGGGGAGEGEDSQRANRGGGGGFGVNARPVGAFVVREGQVRWMPAIDVNRIVLGAQIVAALGLLTLRLLIRTRAASRPRSRWLRARHV